MSDYIVLGDPELCGSIRRALSKHSMPVLSDDGLEIQDEWSVRRWFSRNKPEGTFVCVGLRSQNSISDFEFAVGGTFNVIRAAAGNTKCLFMVSAFPTGDFFMLARLVDLYRLERLCAFYPVVSNTAEKAPDFAERCVLLLRDVLSKETQPSRSEGAHQAGEVPDQVVPQPEGDQQHRQAIKPVLEVPVQAVGTAAPGDLRAECAQRDGEKARGAGQLNPGSV